jgi:hypothetical protein
MKTLDLMVSLGNILPVTSSSTPFMARMISVVTVCPGSASIKSTWQRRCGLESTDGGVISIIICQAPVRLFDKNS